MPFKTYTPIFLSQNDIEYYIFRFKCTRSESNPFRYLIIKCLTLKGRNHCLFWLGNAIRCYQCSSDEDGKYEDNCGAYRKFDRISHIAIECNSEESHMPGSFCMKVTQQSPRGFICKFIEVYETFQYIVYWLN